MRGLHCARGDRRNPPRGEEREDVFGFGGGVSDGSFGFLAHAREKGAAFHGAEEVAGDHEARGARGRGGVGEGREGHEAAPAELREIVDVGAFAQVAKGARKIVEAARARGFEPRDLADAEESAGLVEPYGAWILRNVLGDGDGGVETDRSHGETGQGFRGAGTARE